MNKDKIKERVSTYIKAMKQAWEIWDQYGKNPMSFPPTFLGREYVTNTSFDFQIMFGHQPDIIVKDELSKYKLMNPDMNPPWGCPIEAEYVNVSRCYICGKWRLISGGTACCEVCDGIISKEDWEKELSIQGGEEYETKCRVGKPYSINYRTGTVTVYKDT